MYMYVRKVIVKYMLEAFSSPKTNYRNIAGQLLAWIRWNGSHSALEGKIYIQQHNIGTQLIRQHL